MPVFGLVETGKFSVIQRYEEKNLMPANRAVRCGGKRVAQNVRRKKARVAGEAQLVAKLESDLFNDPDFVHELSEGQSLALKMAHGNTPPPPPTKLTMKHLEGMIEADNKNEARQHKDKHEKFSTNNKNPRPNVNNARANKQGSNKRN